MRMIFRALPAAGVSLVLLAFPLRADYIKNGDLKEGIACWHGDGKIAYLNPDGTEGQEGDPGVTPVIKLSLSHSHRRYVMQEFSTKDNPKTLHLKVEIRPSKDFKRSVEPHDFTDTGMKAGDSGNCGDPFVPDVDFWLFVGPDFRYQLGEVKMANWTTVEGSFQDLDKNPDRAVNFCVPPGEGAVYLKGFVVETGS